MLLSRLRPSKKKPSEDQTSKKKAQKIPELEDFLLKKDYGGACSLLEFGQKGGWDETRALWLGHCYFRGGDYKKAADTYEELMKKPTYPPEVPVYLGCCYFFMGMYADAKNVAEKIPKSSLQNRLMFHASHKLNDEKKLMLYHQQLAADNVEDQLSLASIHYMRMHYAEAIEIYKKILQQNPSLVALNVYIAMCYFKMDYFDVAQEMLQIYLDQYPQSPAALNLRACISYKTYNGKTAIPEIESLLRKSLYPAARDLLNHNMVVFKDGDGALQILPALMDVMPEARVNLIIYHLKKGHIQDALKLCDDLEPQLPTEFLAKAITFTCWGQLKDSKEHLKTAEQYFKMVGESAAECG
ncbi:hypothetical protein WR25_09922 [Diploscapter pachys]|uniref:Intraflagellar transport protein 56 n=1 Tax=Diploscapter pachys TaxID=2018661 RepID=A0A2A2J1S8_9BILA|nr:hypothetical protein WR25_09922 [Diploscapter pachys]